MNILCILICHLPERHKQLRRLLNVLEPQINKFKDHVFYRVNDQGRSVPTGTKRNQLIEQTESDYFCFIDDDDAISEHYLDNIMNALQSNPDVVTFNGYMTTNGTTRRNFTIKLGSRYEERNGHYYRFPNHLCVFRREKVRHIKFPDIHIGEDYAWAKMINDRRILHNEIHINADLYHYQFETNKLNHGRTYLRR